MPRPKVGYTAGRMNLNDTAPVRSGDVLAGKYRVDRVLGVGGMGVVVAATHIQLDQRVALKFMLPSALQNEMAVERFSRESKAAVKLKSEHVARVLDVGVLESGSPYMVMEFLEGIDLHDLIHHAGGKGPPVSVDDAIDYVLQVCDAVAEAHALGIVHRDLKPRNLFLTTGNDGNSVVKVLDFGVSKVSGGANDLSLTRTTEIIGSPNYMSPEQLKASRDVDERSDIWALGCILYELLGGEVPFVAETLTQLTALVLMEAPRPLSDLRKDLPQGLVHVIGRCLEKEPTKRFPNVAALATALDPFAPPQSRGLAERVRRIADASRPPGSRLAPPDRPSFRPPGDSGAGGTSVAWAETEIAAGQKRKGHGRRIALAGGLVVLVGIAAGGGFYAASRHPRTDTSSPSSNPGPAAPTVSTSTAVPPVAETAKQDVPTTPPMITAQNPPPPGPTAEAPKPPTTKPAGTRPHGGSRPAKADAGDDMPSERL